MAEMSYTLLVCVLLCCAVSSTLGAVENLDVKASSDGSFSISVGGKQWFRSGSVGVRDLGQWWSQDEDSLQLTGHTTSSGSDKLGTYTAYQYEWKATGGASTLEILTYINVYDKLPAAVFALVYLDKATNTNISNYVNRTVSSFPSFVIEDGPVDRGYVTWAGNSELNE